jgi:hypothetical protein
MTLQELRPVDGMSLEALRVLLEGKGWSASMPEALPENVLLELTRDFRDALTPSNDDGRGLTVAMFVVLNVLTEHPRHQGLEGEFDISEAGLFQSMQLYLWGLEREVVTRIVGCRSPQISDALIEAMWCSAQLDRSSHQFPPSSRGTAR